MAHSSVATRSQPMPTARNWWRNSSHADTHWWGFWWCQTMNSTKRFSTVPKAWWPQMLGNVSIWAVAMATSPTAMASKNWTATRSECSCTLARDGCRKRWRRWSIALSNAAIWPTQRHACPTSDPYSMPVCPPANLDRRQSGRLPTHYSNTIKILNLSILCTCKQWPNASSTAWICRRHSNILRRWRIFQCNLRPVGRWTVGGVHGKWKKEEKNH